MVSIFLQKLPLHRMAYIIVLLHYDKICQYNIKTFLGQYGKNQSNTDIFHIGPILISLITARSDSARRFNNCKEKSREILDWLINKGIHYVMFFILA
jgi:hypothetical protein